MAINQTSTAGRIKELILNKCDPLSREEEKTASIHDLVTHNLRFMIKSFNKYLKHMDFSEYCSEIIRAMYIAAERYDRNAGYRYITYARSYVSVVLWEYWYQNKNGNYYSAVSINSSAWKRLNNIYKFRETFIKEHKREPKKSDYAKGMKNFNANTFDRDFFLMKNGYSRSTNEVVNDSGDKSDSFRTFGDTISSSDVYSEDDNESDFVKEYEHQEHLSMLRENIAKLEEPYSKVAKCLYIDNMTENATAKKLKLKVADVEAYKEQIVFKLREQMVE